MIRTLTYSLHDLVPYIDWVYFFHAWGLSSSFASIADVHDCMASRKSWVNSFGGVQQTQAREAEKLYVEALDMLRSFDRQYQAKALFGIFPAWSEGDDIVVLRMSENEEADCLTDTERIPFLRQQNQKSEGTSNWCWSDFVAPKGHFPIGRNFPVFPFRAGSPRGCAIGVFVTAVDEQIERLFFEDGYQRMLAQTLADRLAEAAAEKMHEDVRKVYWGYAPYEMLSSHDLFAEKYEGRRPAVGYPSVPDQSVNFLIDHLIKMEDVGVRLTESGMMRPHAAVSGFLFDHPSARHFSVGKIGDDQLKDYACRRNMSLVQCRKFLSANLK